MAATLRKMRTFFGILFAILFGVTLYGWIFDFTGNEPAAAEFAFICICMPCGFAAAWLLKQPLFDR